MWAAGLGVEAWVVPVTTRSKPSDASVSSYRPLTAKRRLVKCWFIYLCKCLARSRHFRFLHYYAKRVIFLTTKQEKLLEYEWLTGMNGWRAGPLVTKTAKILSLSRGTVIMFMHNEPNDRHHRFFFNALCLKLQNESFRSKFSFEVKTICFKSNAVRNHARDFFLSVLKQKCLKWCKTTQSSWPVEECYLLMSYSSCFSLFRSCTEDTKRMTRVCGGSLGCSLAC